MCTTNNICDEQVMFVLNVLSTFCNNFSLCDETKDVANEIFDLWSKCGEQYYSENENELQKIEIVDHCLKTYPNNLNRPTLGCRAIVQRSLRIIAVIMKEAGDWKANVRLNSLKLLWQVILHCEQSILPKFMEIFQNLSKFCKDYEDMIVEQADKCAKLMGMLLDYKSWIDHALEELERKPCIGTIRAFTKMFKAASSAETKEDVLRITELLFKLNLCDNQDEELKGMLLKLLYHLVYLYKQSNRSICPEEDQTDMYLENPFEKKLYGFVQRCIAFNGECYQIREKSK